MQQKFSEFEMVFESTIGDKIFGDTVLIWGNFGQRNNPHPSPPPPYKTGDATIVRKLLNAPRRNLSTGYAFDLYSLSFRIHFLFVWLVFLLGMPRMSSRVR